jgi:hypothetical protein
MQAELIVSFSFQKYLQKNNKFNKIQSIWPHNKIRREIYFHVVSSGWWKHMLPSIIVVATPNTDVEDHSMLAKYTWKDTFIWKAME